MQNHFATYAKPFCPLHKETITNKFGKTSPNAIFKNALSNSLQALENKEKAAILQAAICIGDPNGIRTHITTVKG